MTFITVIKGTTFDEGTVEVQLQDGTFTGAFTGNVTGNIIGATNINGEIICATVNFQTDIIQAKTLNGTITIQNDINMFSKDIGNVNNLTVSNISSNGLDIATSFENVVRFQSPVVFGFTSTNTGTSNLFLGYQAGYSSTSGSRFNVGIGYKSQNALTLGDRNTGCGYQSLAYITTSNENTALGYNAGRNITSGSFNTAIGSKSNGYFNNSSYPSSGSHNVTVGYATFYTAPATGSYNTVVGSKAGNNAGATGELNKTVLFGYGAGSAAIGSSHILIGYNSGISVEGINNIVIGDSAGTNLHSNNNIAIGKDIFNGQTITGAENIIIGSGGLGSGTHTQTIGIGNSSLADRAIAIGHEIVLPSNAVRSISIGESSAAAHANAIAIGTMATASNEDDIEIGNPAQNSSIATAKTWGQIFQNRAWDDGNLQIASISSTGNISKGGIISSLDDVDATSPNTNDVLTWNGTVWIPQVAQGGGGGVSGNIAIFRVDKTISDPQSISSNVATKIRFDTEDSNNINEPGTWNNGSERFTVDTNGWYQISASYRFDNNMSNKFIIQVYIDGVADENAAQSQLYSTGATAYTHVTYTTYLNANQYIEIFALQLTGSAQTIQEGYFSVHALSTLATTVFEPNVSGDIIVDNITLTENGTISYTNGIEIGSNTTTATGNSSIAIGKGAIAGNADSVVIGSNITGNVDGGLFMKHRGPGAYTVNNAGFIAGSNELVEVTSSRRFKRDIRNLEDVDDKFDLLRTVRYKAKPGHGDKREHIGLIAEEVEELFPEFVTYGSDGLVTGVVFDRMIAIVIKELQSVRNRVAILELENQELKNKME